MVRSRLPHIVCLLLTFYATSASAQSDEDKDRASELAQEAVEAFQSDDFVTAAEKFGEAHSYYAQSSLKLNEMVAWYKADNCANAVSVADWIGANVDGLTSADEKDLDRVTSDCAFRDAEAKFEEGDLDGAAAILEQIQTEDGDVALKVGRLQGKIEERRSAQVDPGDGAGDPIETPEDPVEPPPSWWFPAGIGGAGVGGGLAVATLIKYLLEQRSLNGWRELCAQDTQNRLECGSQGLPRQQLDEIKTANTTNAIMWTISGVTAAAGATFLVLHFTRQAAYDEAMKENEPSTTVTVAPTFSTSGGGVTLQVRF